MASSVCSVTPVLVHDHKELSNAAVLAAAAFKDDPLLAYCLPADLKNRDKCIENFMWYNIWGTGKSFPKLFSKVSDSTDTCTICMWAEASPNCGLLMRMPVLLVGAFLRKDAFGASPIKWKLLQFQLGLEKKRANHAGKRHWHLQLIATLPSKQGHGFGAAAIKSSLARADALNMVCYLESSNPKNLPFYERHGFHVVEEVVFPKCREEEPPIIYLMLRKPENVA